MTSDAQFMDELERDLGQAARLRLMLNAGGQKRYIPKPAHIRASSLANEIGLQTAVWLANRFPGAQISFPSRHGSDADERASQLRAAIIEAGLTEPAQSANDIAVAFGVTSRRVHQIRAELRGEASEPALPLFRDL